MPFPYKLQFSQNRAPVSCQLIAEDHLPDILRGNDVLAAVVFSDSTSLDTNDPRLIHIGMGITGTIRPVEVWRGTRYVTTGSHGRISYSENGEVVLGHVLVDEVPSVSLHSLIEQAYDEIREFLSEAGYRHTIRFWNYIPGINRIQDGLERYRAFCVGRHAALAKRPGFLKNLPAASAVGTDSPGLLVTFLAGNVKPMLIENPRQVSAYEYPAVHGPRSPLFSRSVCINQPGWQQIYLSGTASIVGHETRHMDDAVAQAKETCANIRALMGKIGGKWGRAHDAVVEPSVLRVYLRESGHRECIQGVFAECLGADESTIYLRGDICRSNLLLEVEGVFDII
jgi:chorismate lyase/3-hydroxybenzoate synthase